MEALSAKQVGAMEKTRRDVRKETYKALLQQFSRKIKAAVDLRRREAICTVQPFMVGYPRYDLPKTVAYMCRQLHRLGYVVDLIGPLDIRVRWSVTQFEKQIEEDLKPVDILPSLVNLQKTAHQLRNTRKK